MIRQGAISVKVCETERAITNFPGVVALANLAARLGVLEDLEDLLPAKERARGYANSAAAFDMMCIGWSGGGHIDDLEQLRADAGLERLLGRKVMAFSTGLEFLRRIQYDGLDALGAANQRMLAKLAQHTGTTTATLDCDASLFTSSNANARMSYKGERGYMPMLAFWDELGVVVHDDFRHGNAAPGGDALAFLKAALAHVPAGVETINVRSDSAWYQAELLDYCQEQGVGFCIGANRDEAVKQAIMAIEEDNWQRIDPGGEPADDTPYVREWASETVHTLNQSGHSYRLVVIRKERWQDDLFEGPYVYHALITNMDLPLQDQIAWYRRRGECERRIGELKWDFDLRVLPSSDFFVNAAYMRLMTLAYNLFIALKTLALPDDYKPLRLKKLLFKLLAIPAVVTYHARRVWLKLPRGHPDTKIFATAIG